MKHIKLFEEINIPKEDFPEDGHELSSREKQILEDLVGEFYLSLFKIRKEDNYYYTHYDRFFNQLDGFNQLKDYIQFRYYMLNVDKLDDLDTRVLHLLQTTDLEFNFDDNILIRSSSNLGCTETVKLLLKDPRVDPSDRDNFAIKRTSENGNTEIVKLLLEDPRVDPSVNYNYALIKASRNGHREIVKLLLSDTRVRKKLTEEEIKEYEAY